MKSDAGAHLCDSVFDHRVPTQPRVSRPEASDSKSEGLCRYTKVDKSSSLHVTSQYSMKLVAAGNTSMDLVRFTTTRLGGRVRVHVGRVSSGSDEIIWAACEEKSVQGSMHHTKRTRYCCVSHGNPAKVCIHRGVGIHFSKCVSLQH